jgi:hypothetical protein
LGENLPGAKAGITGKEKAATAYRKEAAFLFLYLQPESLQIKIIAMNLFLNPDIRSSPFPLANFLLGFVVRPNLMLSDE